MTAKAYVKKPRKVYAIRFGIELENVEEVFKWVTVNGGEIEYSDANKTFTVKTLEGRTLARPGDWIIMGVKKEFYPCRDDIFRETYEVADES